MQCGAFVDISATGSASRVADITRTSEASIGVCARRVCKAIVCGSQALVCVCARRVDKQEAGSAGAIEAAIRVDTGRQDGRTGVCSKRALIDVNAGRAIARVPGIARARITSSSIGAICSC